MAAVLLSVETATPISRLSAARRLLLTDLIDVIVTFSRPTRAAAASPRLKFNWSSLLKAASVIGKPTTILTTTSVRAVAIGVVVGEAVEV